MTSPPDHARAAATAAGGQPEQAAQPRLLIVDDDESCRWALRRAFELRGYAVRCAHSVPDALAQLREGIPDYAVVDLRMPGPSGLTLVSSLKQASARTRIVMLTGYSSVATAVEAVKLGAADYLLKPVDANAIEAAFGRCPAHPKTEIEELQLPSVERLAWEHIQRTLAQHGGNVSATARALGMHRRTLQRKLKKRPSRR